MNFTDGSGNSVSLAGRLGAGGEAEVFDITGCGDLVAKVYRHPSAERAAKLQVMISAPPDDPTATQGHRSICWPTSLLFDHHRSNVGFLMPRVDSLDNLPLFMLCNPQSRQEVAPGFTWQYLMRAAVNIASVVSAIHAVAYVVGDLNESNILVSDTALVSLVDCDSMQVPQPGTGMFFRCPVGKPEFTPPELQGCDFGCIDRTCEHDNFGLGVLIFQLLMEGAHPFSGIWQGAGEPPPIEERIRRGSSPYVDASGTKPMPGAPPFSILPSALQALFLRCFYDGHQIPGARPTPREWQKALETVEASLHTCARNQRHIFCAHLADCPWCERTRLLGGWDPFPVAPQQRPLKQSRFGAPALAPQQIAPFPPPTVIARPAMPPVAAGPARRPNWAGRAMLIGACIAVTVALGFWMLQAREAPLRVLQASFTGKELPPQKPSNMIFIKPGQQNGRFTFNDSRQFSYDGNIFVGFDFSSATQIALSPLSPDGIHALVFTFDAIESRVLVLNLESLKADVLSSSKSFYLWNEWSPNGRRVLFAESGEVDDSLYIADISSTQKWEIKAILEVNQNTEMQHFVFDDIRWIATDRIQIRKAVFCNVYEANACPDNSQSYPLRELTVVADAFGNITSL